MNRKRTNSILGYLFVCFLLVISSVDSIVSAQNKKDLEGKKKALQDEIKYTNELLKETKKNKKLSLNQLVTLNKKINIRQELIYTINSEIKIINKQISENNKSIAALEADLKKLKEEYAKMIYFAYRNRDSYGKLMFVFASKDFNQAYLRLKYFQQYSDYRKKQAAIISQTQVDLNVQIAQLEQRKTEKTSLLSSEQQEKINLDTEKKEKEEVLVQLQDKEKQLKKELEKKKKDAEKLQAAIQRIIEEEIKKAREKAKEEKRPESKSLVLTPESQQLSNTFSNNKGKLPWPVIKGIITERFGIHPHPLMPDIEVSNNGLDISTTKGALARAVFEGEVTGVTSVPGIGNVVIIRHGEFLSVYSNLNKVFVKAGDKIKTKESIGNINFNEDQSATELHIEIWKGQTKLDPEQWLVKIN
ncbi:MAG: peptidoglycan DD-metalloendopeptidase family protein [Bacteroidetes bacterium]|nr:peptidoglycan DD-metalloendopeptidase family protein [Bacteroidota bacterium]